ncbi:MAG TPA: DUF305 domain-containing protein [Ignavibacteria bacterium]|nr:DUF305 domain-containing protein [Ignavibacteria bacterium]
MLSLSFVIMYAVMFLNIDDLSHIYLSLTRLYMSLLMVSPMAILMLLLMPKMYTDKKLNAIILIVSVVVFIISLTFLRMQTIIGDKQYMLAMIPHHSSAILTSQNADLQDPEVKQLAEDIIKAQEKEITQMKNILERMEK